MAVRRPVALVMGVANHRSIAWACVETMRRRNFDVLLTYQNQRSLPSIQNMIRQLEEDSANGCRIHALPCNVETEIPALFQERIPELLERHQPRLDRRVPSVLDAVVHSIAFAPYNSNKGGEDEPDLLFSQAALADFLNAQHISAYSLIETAKYAKPLMAQSDNASITGLSYLGAVKAVPQYHLMGPAKASLEACVRALAAELGHFTISTTTRGSLSDDGCEQAANSSSFGCIRVNAVSAGPLRTLSSRGIPQFTTLWQHVQNKAPLRRNVTQQEVANTVAFLATEGTGITGQTMYVDAGYSSVVPI